MTDNNPQGPATQRTEGPNMSNDNSTAPTVQSPATTEVTHLERPQAQHSSEPSPEFPTRAFLDKNYRKPNLQKRCRELGITNVWTSIKSQLIDKILEKSDHYSTTHHVMLCTETHTP